MFKNSIVAYTSALLLLPLCMAAQTTDVATFSGTVTDAETGEPIPGVNVYLAGSTSGSSTDSLGNYTFRSPLTGSHQLVCSFLSYKTQSKNVEIGSGDSFNFNFRLEPRTVALNEVQVVSSNKEWRRNYEYFELEFLGRTDFADRSEITNPWVLDFSEDNNILKASANQPLIIENNALGYRIHVELVQFEWNTSNRQGVYKLYSRFEELEAESADQRREWLQNRVETFHGSSAHFFQTLYRSDPGKHHYALRNDDDLIRMSEGDLRYRYITTGNTLYLPRKGWKAFTLDQRVRVQFTRILRYNIEGEEVTSRLRKRSWIAPAKRHKMFFVNRWGLLRDPASVRVYGLWSDHRMANSLPINFTHSPGKES